MDWYENKKELAGAIDFILKFDCCYGWEALASKKTPCSDYSKLDKEIPEALRQAIWEYLKGLTEDESYKLNKQFSMLLGERFFVRQAVIVKILSRLLCEGDPRENKSKIAFALEMQMKQRMELLKTLVS